MPSKEKNIFNIPRASTSKSKWSLMPYFLYFLIPLIISVQAYIYRSTYSGFESMLVGIGLYWHWGLFIVGCVSYYVTRKIFIKKVGVKYTIYVFIGVPLVVINFFYAFFGEVTGAIYLLFLFFIIVILDKTLSSGKNK